MWGGHLELQALAGALKVPITVYEATADNFVAKVHHGMPFLGCSPHYRTHSDFLLTRLKEDDCEGEPLELSYHRHMFSLGEHYNSVVRH